MASRTTIVKNVKILVIGLTGAGKSHLIKTLYGDNSKIITNITEGTQSMQIVSTTMKYINTLGVKTKYNTVYIDTKGLIDAKNNQNNKMTILKKLIKEHPSINYIFICVEANRLTIQSANIYIDMLNELYNRNVTDERIKIMFTRCDCFNFEAEEIIKETFNQSDFGKRVLKCEKIFCGSFDSEKIIIQLNKTNDLIDHNITQRLLDYPNLNLDTTKATSFHKNQHKYNLANELNIILKQETADKIGKIFDNDNNMTNNLIDNTIIINSLFLDYFKKLRINLLN